MKNIYIAGKMRGLKDFNFPSFYAVASILRAEGHSVFNPAARDEEVYGKGFAKSETGNLDDIPDFDLRAALLADVTYILTEADTIVLLPGWETSKGANAELAVARAVGCEVIEWKQPIVLS